MFPGKCFFSFGFLLLNQVLKSVNKVQSCPKKLLNSEINDYFVQTEPTQLVLLAAKNLFPP